MDEQNLKEKIIQTMMADTWNSPKAVNDFILLVAKDFTDVNNLGYFLTIHDALCSLEGEGKVVDVSESAGERSKFQAIKSSRWKLAE
jgi:hypothetical protein